MDHLWETFYGKNEQLMAINHKLDVHKARRRVSQNYLITDPTNPVLQARVEYQNRVIEELKAQRELFMDHHNYRHMKRMRKYIR
jgi:hypothetical protein